MHNYQAVIIMNFKLQSHMISFTSKLLESYHVDNSELAIIIGC